MVKIKAFKLILTIGILMLLITGCNSQSQHITIKNSPMSWHLTNIPSETGSISFDYKLNRYFILDTLTGFMIGNNLGTEVHNSVEENRSHSKSNIETVLLKTKDGGLSFQKSTLGKGTLENIVNDTKGNLYMIKSTYQTDSIPQKFSILKSIDEGDTWHNISDFNEGKLLNIQFYNEQIGIVGLSLSNSNSQLLKTVDGGKTWQDVPIKSKGLSVYDMVFIGENELFTFVDANGLRQTAKVNFTTGDAEPFYCNLPVNFSFSGLFKDHITGSLYSRVYSYENSRKLMLYNHTTQTLKTCNLNNNKEEVIAGVNVSQKFISVLKNDNGKTYYYYSTDMGENWTKESLPDYLADGRPVALYGKGLVWVKSIKNLYNLQVRTPDLQ